MALPFSVPFLGDSLNVLPFVMTALNIPATLLQAPQPQNTTLKARHKRRAWIMAAIFLVLFYTFPAAMVLYWTVNNLVALGIVLSRNQIAARDALPG